MTQPLFTMVFECYEKARPTETVRKFSKPSHILGRQLINVRQCFVCHSSWVEILQAQLSSTKSAEVAMPWGYIDQWLGFASPVDITGLGMEPLWCSSKKVIKFQSFFASFLFCSAIAPKNGLISSHPR